MPLNKVDITMLEDIPAPGEAGKVLTSDGTDWTSADAAGADLPAVGADGNVLTSDGTNWGSEAAAAGLPAVGADGNVLTSDGTNWASEASAAGGGGDSLFPFYQTDGTSDPITITGGQFPFYIADGTLDNIAAPGGGIGLSIAIPGSSVTGDTLYHDGSVYTRLAKGTAAQVLKMNSGATAPEWGEDAGLPATGADGNVLTSDGTNWASEAPAGGGGGGSAWTTSATGTFSGNTELVVNMTTSTRITITNLELGATANLSVHLRESGSNVTGQLYCFVSHTYRAQPSDDSITRDANDTSWPLNPYVTNMGSATAQIYVQITIMAPEDGTHDTTGHYHMVGPESSDTVHTTYGALQFRQNSVVDGFRISGATMNSGDYIIEELG